MIGRQLLTENPPAKASMQAHASFPAFSFSTRKERDAAYSEYVQGEELQIISEVRSNCLYSAQRACTLENARLHAPQPLSSVPYLGPLQFLVLGLNDFLKVLLAAI